MNNYNRSTPNISSAANSVGVKSDDIFTGFKSFNSKSIASKNKNYYKIFKPNQDLEYEYDASIFEDYYKKNSSYYDNYWKNLGIDVGVGVFSSAMSIRGLFGLSLGTFNATAGIKGLLKGKSFDDAFNNTLDGALIGNYTFAKWVLTNFGSTEDAIRSGFVYDGFRSDIVLFVDKLKVKHLLRKGMSQKEVELLNDNIKKISYSQSKRIKEKGLGFFGIKDWLNSIKLYRKSWEIIKYIPDDFFNSKNPILRGIEKRKLWLELNDDAKNNYFSGKVKGAVFDAAFLIVNKISDDYLKGINTAVSVGDYRFKNYYIKKAILSDLDEIIFSAAGVFVFGVLLPFGGYAVGTKSFNVLYDKMWDLCGKFSGLAEAGIDVRLGPNYDKIIFERLLLKEALKYTNSSEIYENNKELYNNGGISKADLDDSAIRFFVDDIGYGTPQALVFLAKQYENGTLDIMPYLDGGRYSEFGVNQEWYDGKSGLDSVGFANYLLINSGFGIDVNSIDEKYMIDIKTAIGDKSKHTYTGTLDKFTKSKKIGCMLCNKNQDGKIIEVGIIVKTSEEYVYVQTFTSNGVEIKKYRAKYFDTDVVKDYNTMIDMAIYDDIDNQNYVRSDIQETLSDIKESYKIQYYKRSYIYENYVKSLYDDGAVSLNTYQNAMLTTAADSVTVLNDVGEARDGYGTSGSIKHVTNFFLDNQDTIKITYLDQEGYTGFGIKEDGFSGRSIDFVKYMYTNSGFNADIESKFKDDTTPPKYAWKYTDGDLFVKDIDNDGKITDADEFYIVIKDSTSIRLVGLNKNGVVDESITPAIADDYKKLDEYKYIPMKSYINNKDNLNYERTDKSIYSVPCSEAAKNLVINAKKLYDNGYIEKYEYDNIVLNFLTNGAGYGTTRAINRLVNYTISANQSGEFKIPYSDDGTYNNFGVDPEWNNGNGGLNSFGYAAWIYANAGYKADNLVGRKADFEVSKWGDYNIYWFNCFHSGDILYSTPSNSNKLSSDSNCAIINSINMDNMTIEVTEFTSNGPVVKTYKLDELENNYEYCCLASEFEKDNINDFTESGYTRDDIPLWSQMYIDGVYE